MILKLDMTAEQVAERFSWLESTLIEPYRDATFTEADFHLHLLDCWRGLDKGKSQGWVRYASSGFMWGEIDIEQYEHYDNPTNGYMHIVVPGKFVAFQGPHDIGDLMFQDDAAGVRTLSPAFYAPALREMGVTTIAGTSGWTSGPPAARP